MVNSAWNALDYYNTATFIIDFYIHMIRAAHSWLLIILSIVCVMSTMWISIKMMHVHGLANTQTRTLTESKWYPFDGVKVCFWFSAVVAVTIWHSLVLLINRACRTWTFMRLCICEMQLLLASRCHYRIVSVASLFHIEIKLFVGARNSKQPYSLITVTKRKRTDNDSALCRRIKT